MTEEGTTVLTGVGGRRYYPSGRDDSWDDNKPYINGSWGVSYVREFEVVSKR